MNILSLPARWLLFRFEPTTTSYRCSNKKKKTASLSCREPASNLSILGGGGGKAEKDTRNEGSCEERQLRDFHGDFPPSETASDP
jgi:hypothetical protein